MPVDVDVGFVVVIGDRLDHSLFFKRRPGGRGMAMIKSRTT